jgi:hypothetical protein
VVILKKHEKETYEKPKMRTEEIELSAYGQYGSGPLAQLQPMFGLCCP